ncbi:protein takeout-like [Chrysoperla carnea]|uniref:protein takeout-like n=1 Tax=Chrysoperla carnea TaxID=189513 RepID=UPI001D07C303|nr:protein takeout-like [Chrysoperla carnea]
MFIKFLLIFLIGIPTIFCAKLPDYIKPCKLDDANLNSCAYNNAKAAIPRIAQGDPKYNLPSLSPLHIHQITLGGSRSLNLSLSHVDIIGIPDVDLQTLGITFNDSIYRLTASANVPKLNVKGDYKINGRILILPITGNGPANINLDDVFFEVEYDLKPETKNSKEYLKLVNDNIEMKVKHVTFKFENLFNGDKRLSAEMDKFIANNSQEIFNELKPAIIEVIKTVCLSILKGITNKVPLDELFVK